MQFPGRGDVSSYLPSLLYQDFIEWHSLRERAFPSVRGQCCFAGKVSKSRYTSSIFVSEGEWNEFHAQVSKVVYVTVQIASGARTKNARHSGNAAIINPHFKCCLLKSELNCHWRLGGGEREHFETFTAPEDSFYGADTRICSARMPFQLDFEIQGNTGLVSLVFVN